MSAILRSYFFIINLVSDTHL
jgi:hypothetical protein